MTPEQIVEIKARADAATPGPWSAVQEAEGEAWHCATGKWVWHAPSRTTFWTEADAKLMAHARQDIPALLDEIAFLQERLDRANADYEACVQSHQKVNVHHEVMLGLLCDLEDAEQQGTVTMPGALWQRIKAFLDSE